MKIEAVFSGTYAEARNKFRKAAASCDAELRSYACPGFQAVSMDVAILGSRTASSAMLMLSGTHGVEGFAGSAAQIGWLSAFAGHSFLAQNRVVLVHAVNPWGFAHDSRTTAQNIDLNRNFVDFASDLPGNRHYAGVHSIISRPDLDLAGPESVWSNLEAFEERAGRRALSDALGRGQYEFTDGIKFGGKEPDWSNLTLKRVLHEFLGGVERLAVIDWHTGRGDFGETFFLCFSPVGSDGFERAADWWGREVLVAKDKVGEAYEGEAPPPRHGLLIQGVEEMLQPAQVAGAVIEIGTFEPRRVVTAEIIDRWLLHDAERNEDKVPHYKAEVRETFYPDSRQWRHGLLDNALAAIEQMIGGLQRW